MAAELRFYTNILLILAFLTSGISPACQFISGATSIIEICAADGTLKTIELPADQSPLPQEPSNKHKTNFGTDCAFCYSASNLKTLKTDLQELSPTTDPKYISTGPGGYILKRTGSQNFDARGPPLLLS